MARRVFFSFHFERDYWRVGQIRSHWLTKNDHESAGYWDAAKWEEVRKQGDEAIKRWINNALDGASVTIVLIGAETASREWVDYEIKRSSEEKMGLLGIYIHNMKDINSFFDRKGVNPLDTWFYTNPDGSKKYFSEVYKTYDWVGDRGYDNFANWVEDAAKQAGR